MDDVSRGLENLEHILDGTKGPTKLKLSVLRQITLNFSEDRKIGKGGYGSVYKGILPGRGKTVAVKKFVNNEQTMDDTMFRGEAAALMNVKHQNIVQFIGYCSHTEQQALQMSRKYILADEPERLLCFEYICNGSLEDHITDELRGLEWEKRFQIIRGICEGLRYLHKEKRIIHMDLKPPNILLSDALVPKITDFGISRLGETTKTMSKIRIYTPGYCCPEYLVHGKRSFKSDIYSLGVTIIEIVTGTREDNPNITNVCRRWRHRWNKSAVDKTLLLGWRQQVVGCLELAQRGRNSNPTERPDILDIIRELNETNSSHASKSIVEPQKNSFLDDMLGIEPLELRFSPKLNEQISHSIQLTNDTQDYVAFRVSPTRLLPSFYMHPNTGIVPPWSWCNVTITLEAPKKLLEEKCVAELCVQSTRVDKVLTTNEITAGMFKEGPNKVVDAVNLTIKISAPKQLLVVDPLELRCWPIEASNELLFDCSLQLTNRIDDYVAFTIILLQGNVAIGTGIMPPCSTRGVVTNMLVKEEALAEICKDTCLVRSIAVKKDLMDDDISMEFFNEQTGVHEMELDIVFAEPSQAPSSAHHPTYKDEKDWEDDKLGFTRDQAVVISPFSIETEVLQIYPAELRFANELGREFINLINKTGHDVTFTIGRIIKGKYIPVKHWQGVVPPYYTAAAYLYDENMEKHQVLRVLMISGSRRYETNEQLIHGRIEMSYSRYQSECEEVMNWVRAEGGKAHETLLPCIKRDPHPECEVTLHMHEHGLAEDPINCMDVHPTEPWVVTGHWSGAVCIWKVDPKANIAPEMIMSTPNTDGLENYHIESVKFIARKKWIACGDAKGCVTVYTYNDNRVTKFKTTQANKSGSVYDLAVHPRLSYLVSFSASNSVQLWDWDQEWMCTGEFSLPAPGRLNTKVKMTCNPKDDNTFTCVGDEGEIYTFSIDSREGTTRWRGSPTYGIAYCNTGTDLPCIVAKISDNSTIELVDLLSSTRVHTLGYGLIDSRYDEDDEWFIASHTTRPLFAAASHGGASLWNYTIYG